MVLLRKTVAMVGMMGAGKTSVGMAVAEKLCVPFMDSDEEIVKAANAPISEIFARDGEAFFRARESEVIARILRGPPCILSTGGGVFLFEHNRTVIAESGVSVWLKVDLDVLWQRVRHKNTRPLLQTDNPRETLRSLYARRVPFYEQAQIVVHADDKAAVGDTALAVIAALHKHGDIFGDPADAV